MKKYDTLVIGPISLDINIDYTGQEQREIGGAVVQSGYAASKSGAKTAIFTKLNPEDADPIVIFADSGADVFWNSSKQTTSIRNEYYTADKERRSCYALSQCDPFSFSELPKIQSSIYHFAGLMVGDFDFECIKLASELGYVAVDVQCLLRTVEPDATMKFYDYAKKHDLFPHITYLKTDTAEAEILTGLSDRFEMAKKLHSFGSKEIMISHNTEILVYDGENFYTHPIKSRNLSGRSGRGDTVFASYITQRLHSSPDDSLRFAAALVSLKMETPGPFKGCTDDINKYIKDFYL